MNGKLLAGLGIGAVLVIVVAAGVFFMNKTANTGTKANQQPELIVGEGVPESVNNPGSTDAQPTEMVTTTGKTVEVTVEGSSFKFVPAEIRVKKGDTVKVVFKNTGGMHDFVIDEFEVKTNQIGDGEEEEVEFVANKAGSFEYYCSVGQHRQMGMVGKLIVE